MTRPANIEKKRTRTAWVPTGVSWTAVGLLVALVAPLVLLMAPQVIGHDAGYVVVSGSMSGTFEAGDLVFVRAVAAEELGPGDIISFNDARGAVVTHRIVAVHPGHGAFTTQGDANDDADPQPVEASEVLGRYGFRVPSYGHIAIWAGSGIVPLLLVYAVGLPLLVTEAWRITGAVETAVQERRAARPLRSGISVLGLILLVALASASAVEPTAAAFHDSGNTSIHLQSCVFRVPGKAEPPLVGEALCRGRGPPP